jgi:hypothetical protein
MDSLGLWKTFGQLVTARRHAYVCVCVCVCLCVSMLVCVGVYVRVCVYVCCIHYIFVEGTVPIRVAASLYIACTAAVFVVYAIDPLCNVVSRVGHARDRWHEKSNIKIGVCEHGLSSA